MISYDDFKKMDICIGTIKSVEPVEGTDKLLRCMVDTGDPELRQIVSGIREYVPDYESLVGRQLLYIVNLEPRMIRGIESHGMLLAVDGLVLSPEEVATPVFLVPESPVAPGSKIR